MNLDFFKRKKEQKVLQAMLQAEDDAFHRTLVALERLETYLLPEGVEYPQLRQTAMGTSRDHHDNTLPIVNESMYYLELSLDVKGLYMCSEYDDPEIFKVAAESFISDLLEWYGGRILLDFYDAVDTAIIPLLASITHKTNKLDDLFDKYVYETPILSNESTSSKLNAVQEGVNAWLKGQHIYEHEARAHAVNPNSEMITSHYRGTALDGYKRIIAALSSICDNSAPLKMFVKTIREFLPAVADQLPNINEDAIDRMYDKRNNPDISDPKPSGDEQSISSAELAQQVKYESTDSYSNINPEDGNTDTEMINSRAFGSDINQNFVNVNIHEQVEESNIELGKEKSLDLEDSEREKSTRILSLAQEIVDLVKPQDEKCSRIRSLAKEIIDIAKLPDGMYTRILELAKEIVDIAKSK